MSTSVLIGHSGLPQAVHGNPKWRTSCQSDPDIRSEAFYPSQVQGLLPLALIIPYSYEKDINYALE